MINLTREENECEITEKIYLYAKYLSERKYQHLIKKHEDAGIKNVNNPKAFIEYSNTMDGVYENIGDYNLSRKKT